VSESEQIKAFVGELQAVVERFRNEFDLPMASAIGCLEVVKLAIFEEIMQSDEEDEE
jgi:hypothetical protein